MNRLLVFPRMMHAVTPRQTAAAANCFTGRTPISRMPPLDGATSHPLPPPTLGWRSGYAMFPEGGWRFFALRFSVSFDGIGRVFEELSFANAI